MKKILLIHWWDYDNYYGRIDKEAWHNRTKFVNELEKYFEIRKPDLPGFGLQKEPNVKKYTIEDYADYIHDYIVKNDFSPDYILGYSFGGAVAVTYLEKYGDVKLILVSPALIRNHDNSKSSLELKIPKILNKEGNKAVPATYNIRLFSVNSFQKDDDKNTISFIPYFPFAVYIYKILGNNKGDQNTDPITTIIDNYPEDKTYFISIIATTNEEEKQEIFAYEKIDDPYKEQDKEVTNSSYTAFLFVSIIVVIVLIVIFAIVIYRMVQKKKHLESEILRVSKMTSNSSSFGKNKDPTNEYFLKEPL